MTLYESTQQMDQKIQEMYNTLYDILTEYTGLSRDLNFTQLIQLVEEIPGDKFYYTNNIKPINNITFNYDDTLLRKEIKIYYKIEFLTKYLKYALRLNGISEFYTNEIQTLYDAIQLVDLIRQLKTSILTLDVQQYTYYFNSYCIIPYTLTSEDGNINDGDIVVLEDDIEIARIKAGEELKFLPSDTGVHTYSFYYEGSIIYKPTNPQEYIFTILPARIRINADAINIGNSQYKNDKHIGYDEDTFELTINTINPYINFPAANIPFYVEVPQKNNKKIIKGITDQNGIAKITFQSDKIDTFNIFIQTTTDGSKVSNNNTDYNITIYHNPIKIKDYIFYEHQQERDMELFFYNNDGTLTNKYLNNNYNIIVNQTYRNFNLNNKTNPFIIQEEHNELGRYDYEYILKYQNNVIATTSNIVYINKEIKIKIVPENKFISNTTNQIKVHIYTTDYEDRPLSIPVYFLSSYAGNMGNVYTTNENGYYYATININDISSKCNGFLLQAVASNDNNVISNAIYYRINNEESLDTYIEIDAEDDYNLNNTNITVKIYLTDSEGEDVFRTVQLSDGIHTYTLQYQPMKQCYEKTFALDENQIGDNININVTYSGESNHYNSTTNRKIIEFTKSNVNNVFNYSEATVYEELSISATLNIENNNNFNKYIGNNLKISIDNVEYSMNKNNNIFSLSITPLNAGNVEIIEQYLGNKWTNPFTNRRIINIAKTSKYNFDIELDNNEVLYRENITFHPLFSKLTTVDQQFLGTITYNFSNGYNTTQNIEDYTYRTTTTGNQTVAIAYSGDNNHNPKSLTKTFTVKKLTPTISLIVPEVDAMYRSDIDYKTSKIGYTGNDEGLTVRVYDNNIEKYNQSNKEHDEEIFNITSAGQHTIKLKTDETNIYNSLTIEKNIEAYDFLEETYKILNNETENYSIEEEIEQIFDCILNNASNYDEDTLEGLYKILEHLED